MRNILTLKLKAWLIPLLWQVTIDRTFFPSFAIAETPSVKKAFRCFVLFLSAKSTLLSSDLSALTEKIRGDEK